ncbi:hypothetical protein V495_04397 [Pseudogymnoascus sp. VKM F-4514 (FW-929)]|nr:hypothetical protein V495_04397 [Pseudogymnoascus sp. VKM F-4514 (FW-929)]KFY51252.1 hypothetical protein V497_09269 [Pseudogymnoascus sp. VKM F-4516 (FW-969)]
MTGCSTCRFRKVKCDGRLGLCLRCEKLGLECKWRASRPNSAELVSEEVTRAGHKRLRASVACETCRKRKLKCDAGKPSCSACLRRGISCIYDQGRQSQPEKSVPVPQILNIPESQGGTPMESVETDHNHDRPQSGSVVSLRQDVDMGISSRGSSRLPSSPRLPTGPALLPYLDSYLSNVHPICLNNVLHPGVLCEAFEKSPRLLLLAICGVSAKFLDDPKSKANGRSWVAEAKSMVMENLDQISTLPILALQTLAMHDIHEADITSAWNLTGISIRMALQLKLNHPAVQRQVSSSRSSGTFLKDECSRRLMWSVFGADILLASDEMHGTPCTTLLLHDESNDAAAYHATNPNGYFIRILALKRRITNFIRDHREFNREPPWMETSQFYEVVKELEDWRKKLPPNMTFEERHMYTFRTSRHLDMFLMVHVWYHQCGCDLFGTWIQDRGAASADDPNGPALAEFLQKCRDRHVYHAQQISRLLEKMLRVEPDHLFRDPWLSFCILDSVTIQLANEAIQQQPTSAESRKELCQLLKFNIKALANTKETIILADKVHEECCDLIQQAGLGEAVFGNTKDKQRSVPRQTLTNHTIELLCRYPFLMPAPPPEMESWDNLFNATSVSTPATRQASPEGGQPPSVIRRPVSTRSSQERQSQNGIGNMGYMGDTSMQLFPPWQAGDFQWWQTSGNNMESPSAGMSHPAVSNTPGSTDNDQGLLEFFANSMAPTGTWQVEQGFDSRFLRPNIANETAQ